MRRAPSTQNQVNRDKTSSDLRNAIGEVQHAARTGRRSLPKLISWGVALATGAAVAWRSLRAANPAAEHELGAVSPIEEVPTKSNSTARIEARADEVRSVEVRDGSAAEHTARHGTKTPVRNDSGFSKKTDKHAGGTRTDGTAVGSDAAQTDRDKLKDRPTHAKTPGAMMKELFSRFQGAECMTRSQALAFIGVLSLGPVLLFALAALGFVIHDTAQVERFVHDLIGQLLPGRQASEAANNLIAQTHIIESARTLMQGKWWAVSIGIVSLLWTAIGLFAAASDAMNANWGVRETRSFINLRLICLAVFAGAGILFLLSLVPSSLPSLVGKVNHPLIGAIPPGQWWVEVVAWMLAIIVNAAMFTVIYRFLPNASVNWKSALFGGAVAGLFWELFKKGFAVYLAHFGNFNKLYGALGGAVLLVTWIWYSCLLLLIGAILCKMYREHTSEGGVVRTPNAEGSSRQPAR